MTLLCYCQALADGKIKVPSVENSELTNLLTLKPGVGQNIATDASPTARNFFLDQISTFLVRLLLLFLYLLPI